MILLMLRFGASIHPEPLQPGDLRDALIAGSAASH
jgi:hypothetical protein